VNLYEAYSARHEQLTGRALNDNRFVLHFTPLLYVSRGPRRLDRDML